VVLGPSRGISRAGSGGALGPSLTSIVNMTCSFKERLNIGFRPNEDFMKRTDFMDPTSNFHSVH